MLAQLSITLSHLDNLELAKISNGNRSEKIREILETADLDTIKAVLDQDKTTIKADIKLAQRIQEIADALGVAPGRVVRAAVEAHLHTKH